MVMGLLSILIKTMEHPEIHDVFAQYPDLMP